ncbi:Glutamate receptor ionotropic kainate 3 [Bienertia sinuspersici]
MMDNNYNYWKKKPREENFNGGSRSRSQNIRRSSFGNDRQKQSTLSLEKEFCLVVGGVSWKRLLDTQKYMHQDEKVMQWNDSAVEEAFWNAKKRFWAKTLGQPCDVKLPDPDIFIDKIDWDSNVDPMLMLDLDNRDPDIPTDTDKKHSGVVVGIPVIPEQYIDTPTGWGDDEQFEKPERCDVNWHEYDHWGDNCVNNADKGCSNDWQDGYVYVTHYDNHEENQFGNGGSTWKGSRNKQWDHGYNKKSNRGGRNTSRYKNSRFHYNGNNQSLIDDYGNNKRGDFSNSERPPLIKWRPVSRQW